MVRAEARRRMREQILEGALKAIALHGLVKAGMKEVGQCAGVSRGTVYRYFPRREDLLMELAERETARLRKRLERALEETADGSDRIGVVVRHAAWHVHEHPVLQRLLETDPGFVLRRIRATYTKQRKAVRELTLSLVRELEPVRQGVVTAEDLVDWMTRLLISYYLFQDPNPERASHSLTAVFNMMRKPALWEGGLVQLEA